MIQVRDLQSRKSSKAWLRFISSLVVGVFLFTNIGLLYAFDVAVRTPAMLASVFVDIDTDGDGLGDTWEVNYFGGISVYGGEDDPDKDGYTNLWEYQHGSDPTNPGDPNYYIPARDNALVFLKRMMDRRVASGKRILYSYIDRDGNTEGYGWTYDNAISILAFELRGEWQRAKDILDAYIWFQERDPARDPNNPAIGDGRIRRAYWANLPIDDQYIGDCSPWIPDTNSEASNQAIGDMAFMILAALRYHEYLGQEDSAYLNFAKRLGDWIYNNAKSDKGNGGYNMARRDFELADPANYDRKSTENNIDVYVAFMKLYEAANDHKYRTYALYAKNFVLSMWNQDHGMFWTGTLDDGITTNGGVNSDVIGYDGINPTSGQPEDPSTWGLLALGEANKYERGITWVDNNCRVENIDGFLVGYDFNADRDGIWFEGSCHTILAYQMLGDNAKANSILDEILKAQDADTGGIMCASHNGITTSFPLWTLNTDLHIAPTSWLIFAVDNYNPFWNQPISDPVPYEGGYNIDGTQYIFDEPWTEVSVNDISPATDGTARAIVELEGIGGDDKGTINIADDGIIVKYEWDFDGKGTYDWSSTTTGRVTYWYTEVGRHLARFRITNDKGFVSTRGVVINITQADLGAGFLPPVVSNVSASVLNGQAPLTVSFTALGSDSDGYIASYQWDFDGDGEYDSYSESSGNITYTYSEKGLYEPTIKITDNDGLTDTASLAIEVLENPDGPLAKAGSDEKIGTAPFTVNFYAVGSLGNITKYEWDFEGDGTYDWVATQEDVATYLYGEPGTYRAKLRVTDVNGISDTDTVTIRVIYNSVLVAPEAIGTATPSDGVIPFDVQFSHSSSVGNFGRYEWDFEGDKNFDRTTEDIDDIIYTYTRPGYYFAVLKVVDQNNLSHRTYIPIVATGPQQAGARYSSYIKTPQSGKRIYGNSVTVAIAIAPNNRNQTASLQYKPTTAGEDAWTELGTSIVYPYRTTIDVTSLPTDTYDFQSPINGIADKAKRSLVIIDPIDWDIHEELNGDGERVKRVKVKKDEDISIELIDGTICEVSVGTLSQDDMMTIRTPNGSGRLIIGDGTNTISYHREFTLSSNSSLNKPVTIKIPYEDNNNDGIVDGLNIREEELGIYAYDEDTKLWKPLANFTVYTDENYVSGQTSHLSIFGLGSLGGPGIGAEVAGAGGVVSALGGGGRSCFIATATFGTPMAEEVQVLRVFRDTYLLTNRPGNFIIDMYERYSPPIARIIEKRPFLKMLVRYYLRPIIKFARFANTIYSCHIIEKAKSLPLWFVDIFRCFEENIRLGYKIELVKKGLLRVVKNNG